MSETVMIQVIIDGSKSQLVPLRQLMLMLGIPLAPKATEGQEGCSR